MAEPTRTPQPPYRTALRVALVAWCVYAATTGGSFATDLASYEVTRSIVEEGSVAMSYDVFGTGYYEKGVDGRFYAPVGLGHPVFGIPFYAAGRLATAAGLSVGKPGSLTKASVVFGSTVAAAGCVFFACLLGWRLSGDTRAGVLASLALAFGTPLWVYAKFGFNAPLAAMCLTAAAYTLLTGTQTGRKAWLVASGVALGYAVITRHEMIVASIPAVVWIWQATRGRRRERVGSLAAFAWPVVAAALVWMIYNHVRFGHPFDTGLLRDPAGQMGTSRLVGLHGLLLSPGRSLLLYAPLTLAGVAALWRMRRQQGAAALFLALHLLLFLLLISKMQQWDGGESYGPRYLVPILPFVTLPIVWWLKAGASSGARNIVWTLATLGVLVQVPGVLVDFSKAQLTFARRQPDYSIALTRYTWAGAPLVLNTRTAVRAVPENLRYLTGRDRPPAVATTSDESDRGFSHRFAFSLDFWWLYLFYLGAIPRWLALLAPALLLLTAAGIARRLPVSKNQT